MEIISVRMRNIELMLMMMKMMRRLRNMEQGGMMRMMMDPPGLLLFLFLELKSLTLEKMLRCLLGLSPQVPVLRVGLQRADLVRSFSFSLSRSLSLA